MAIPSGKMQNADFYNDAAGCRVTLMGISAEYGPDLFPAPTTRGFAGLFIQIMPVFGNCVLSVAGLSRLLPGSAIRFPRKLQLLLLVRF